MEVEDRHLNVMVELINKIVVSVEPLMYLSDQFSPTDIVYRLAQLIIIYENSVLSESPFLPILEKEPNSEPNYCLTIGSIVKLWLLDFYKQEMVTLNKLEVETGFEEEIILTTLMVLRVLYRMRQLMDKRLRLVLTEEWKDLHEFDQNLDQKFDMKSMKLMSLLVKHSINHNLKTISLQKQIDCLKQENNRLSDKLTNLRNNSLRMSSPTIHPIRPIVTTNIERITDPIIDTNNELQSQTSDPTNSCEEQSEAYIKIVTKSPIKRQMISPKKPFITSSVRTNESSETFSALVRSPSPNKSLNKQMSGRKSTKLGTESIRKSPRILKTMAKEKIEETPKKLFRVNRELLREGNDSETENIDKKQTKTTNKVTKPLKRSPIEAEQTITLVDVTAQTVPMPSLPIPIPLRESILPIKKRKPKIPLSPSPTKEITVQQTIDKPEVKPEVKPKRTAKDWPSKKKNYPRKRRYPCNYQNCLYIADRPSTLVRHQRAHTGEKPFACDYPGCDKRYKMSSNLTPHKLTHIGKKPYICDWSECTKRFTYPQHLKRHRNSHINNERLIRRRLLTKSITDSDKRLKRELIAITLNSVPKS